MAEAVPVNLDEEERSDEAPLPISSVSAIRSTDEPERMPPLTLLPLLLLGLVAARVRWRPRPDGVFPMIRSSTLAVLAVLSFLAVTRPAAAVKYMTLTEAVTAFIGADAKPFKVSRKVTAEERARLLRDYGWQAEEEYTFYLGKDAAGQPVAYVLVVSERFNTCFHKYAIGLKPDGEVIDTVVVELSCPRSFPINSKGFLKQFRGKRHGDPLDDARRHRRGERRHALLGVHRAGDPQGRVAAQPLVRRRPTGEERRQGARGARGRRVRDPEGDRHRRDHEPAACKSMRPA